MSGTHVVFTVAGRRFALPVQAVRKVRPLGRLTRVPGTAAYVAGAMNDEGAVVPVIDMAVRLGSPRPTGGDPWVVLLAAPHPEAGLLVDAVEDVAAFVATEGEDAPPADLAASVRGRLARDMSTAPAPPGAGAPLDDAGWLRYTLAKSAAVMGFQELATPRTRTEGPHETAAAPIWLLDVTALLGGGAP